MIYPLRNILKSASLDDLVYEMPDIYTGIKIALHADVISNLSNIGQNFSSYDHEIKISKADLSCFFKEIQDEVWIEMLCATEDIPIFGHLPGSHVMIGSALSVCRSEIVNNLNMFLFIAAVDASVYNKMWTVDWLHSLSVSPLKLQFSRRSTSELSLSGYQKIRRLRNKLLENQLLERDFILHRAALNLVFHTHHI